LSCGRGYPQSCLLASTIRTARGKKFLKKITKEIYLSVPAPVSGPVMGVRRRAAMLLGRWLPIEQHAFDIHAQLGHFFKTHGRDVVLPVTLRLVFYDPLQLFGGLNKDTADSERINRSETVLFITLGSHSAPLVDDGKIPALFRFRLKDSLAPIEQQVTAGAQGSAHHYATELKNVWQDFIISRKLGMMGGIQLGEIELASPGRQPVAGCLRRKTPGALRYC
jgi:hypothetical protein